MIALVINPLGTGFSHAVFDAVLLKAFDDSLKNNISRTIFLGEKQHVVEVKKILGSSTNNIAFIGFRKYGQGRLATTLLCARIFHQLNRIKSSNRQLLPIFAAADNTLVPLYLRLNCLNKSHKNIAPVIISHNNMQSIVYKIAKRRRWQRAIEKSHARFMMLENELFEHARLIIGSDSVFKLEHPTYVQIHAFEKAKQIRQQQPFLYDFIMVGRHGRTKESVEEVVQITEEAIGTISGGRKPKTIRIAFTGSEIDFLPRNHKVQLIPIGEYPSFNDYLTAIARSKFIVFPSTAGTRMTASGTLADALSLGTPIIGPNRGGFKLCLGNFNEFDQLFYEDREGLKLSIKYALKMQNSAYRKMCEFTERMAWQSLSQFNEAVNSVLKSQL